MSTTGTFDMVGVNRSPFEGRCCALDEAGLVQGIAVQLALDVVFLTDAAAVSLATG